MTTFKTPGGFEAEGPTKAVFILILLFVLYENLTDLTLVISTISVIVLGIFIIERQRKVFGETL